MKRMSKTTIALVTAGALGFGVIPAAGAQVVPVPGNVDAVQENPYPADPVELTGPELFGEESAEFNEDENPANREDLDATDVFGKEGAEFVESENPVAGREDLTMEELAGEEGETWVDGIAPKDPVEGNGVPVMDGSTTGTEPAEMNNFGPKTTITKVEDGKDKGLFIDENGVYVWHLIDNRGRAINDQHEWIDGVVPATSLPEVKDAEKNTGALLGIAAGIAGLVLLIQGVKYFMNKDGVLVEDPNRVNEKATAEEKAKSDQLMAEHGEEIAAQIADAKGGDAADGNAANGERGIGASTGVNEVPAGLLSLLLASVLGAAAFVFGRRQLI
ncbi:hypothetical protein V6D40_10095 [Corynebacterium sp. Q4381]|uniref:hypothetical protein n=1 Tax=Corynebacterium sp. Marseille-Q4381 TaxID=3121597 RepID=UPI002FE61A02